MRPLGSPLLTAIAALFGLVGLAAFILLFVRQMNVFWFILSPIILAVYELPAVVMLWLARRRKRRAEETEAETGDGETAGHSS